MDPFEVRMQFVSLLSRLTSALASIQKVALFALKHTPRCSSDIWECLVEECSHASLNARVNLLHLIDAVLDKDLNGVWKPLVEKDLEALVLEQVVGEKREGRVNLMSAYQVLKSWKLRRVLDVDLLDSILDQLELRKASLTTDDDASNTTSSFSRNDILRRIEDDRERHKRLRERIWVLPVPTSLFTLPPPTNTTGSSSVKPSPISPSSPSEALIAASPSKSMKGSTASTTTVVSTQRGPEVAIELEFEQTWARLNDERVSAQLASSLPMVQESMAIEPEEEIEENASKGRGRMKKRKVAVARTTPVEGVQVEDVEAGGYKWELDEIDRLAMRVENERCFARTSEMA